MLNIFFFIIFILIYLYVLFFSFYPLCVYPCLIMSLSVFLPLSRRLSVTLQNLLISLFSVIPISTFHPFYSVPPKAHHHIAVRVMKRSPQSFIPLIFFVHTTSVRHASSLIYLYIKFSFLFIVPNYIYNGLIYIYIYIYIY